MRVLFRLSVLLSLRKASLRCNTLNGGVIGGRSGRLIFIAGLVATVASSVLRLHLWFAASSLPDEWQVQREQSHSWLRSSEVGLVIVLAVAGFWVLESQPALGAVLVSAAVAIFLSFTFIEPATTRAAFGR